MIMNNQNLVKRKAFWLCSLFVASVTWMSRYVSDALTVETPNRRNLSWFPRKGLVFLSHSRRQIVPLHFIGNQDSSLDSYGGDQLHKIKWSKSCIKLNLCLWKILEMSTDRSWILRTCELHGLINTPNWYCIKLSHLVKVYLLEKFLVFIWMHQDMVLSK